MKRKIRGWILGWLAVLPIPFVLWKAGVLGWGSIVLHKRSEKALRWLLYAAEQVEQMINYVAMRHEGGVHPKHRIMRYHDFFVGKINDGENVLDVGCGYGEVAHSIAEARDVAIWGIDIDPEKIRLASSRKSHPRITYLVVDATGELFLGKMDVIVISNCLEHIERRVEFLRNLQANICPKRWLVRVPCFDRDWKPSLRLELGMFPYGDSTHFTEYTEKSFRQEMKDAGFVVLEIGVQWGEIWAEVADLASVEKV